MIERAVFFQAFEYRAWCPECTWSGEWRCSTQLAKVELHRHKLACHHPEVLVEPGDFQQQAIKFGRRALEAEMRVEKLARVFRIARLRNVKLQAAVSKCRRNLQKIGMEYLMGGTERWAI